jgi:glycosyltransferase involved in cell wall biosynthesis
MIKKSSFHICFVESDYPYQHKGGGAGTYVYIMGRQIVQAGQRVSVITNWRPGAPEILVDEGLVVYFQKPKSVLHGYLNKIPILNVGALSLRYLENGFSEYMLLEKINQKDPISLVEFSEGGDFWHALKSPFPYICHLHGSRYTFKRMSGQSVNLSEHLNRKLELFFLSRASWVLSPSIEMLRLVTEEAGKKIRTSSVLPLPLSKELVDVQNLDFPKNHFENAKHVFFVARHDPVKGANVLLKAIPIVRMYLPETIFDFFGYKPLPTEKLPEGVKCHGFLSKEDLFKQYKYADICVVPSLWDNSPNTLYEAMAAGKAVVASRVGGIPEIVVDGVTGILVDSNNSDQLAEALISILSNKNLCRDMGINGRMHIRKIADPEKNLENRMEIYNHIVEEARISNK